LGKSWGENPTKTHLKTENAQKSAYLSKSRRKVGGEKFRVNNRKKAESK